MQTEVETTDLFLGLIILVVVAWVIRKMYKKKKSDTAVKQDADRQEEISRKKAEIA